MSDMRAEVEQAYAVLRDGGLIMVKVDVGYALMGHSEESIRRMYELKGRPLSNPAIVIGNLDVLLDVGYIEDDKLQWVKDQMNWTTLAVVIKQRKNSSMWASLPPWLQQQSSIGDTVAVFLNTGTFSDLLVDRAFQNGLLIVGSSANLSFQGNRYSSEEIPQSLKEGVDLFLDHGIPKYANPQRRPTSIVNLTNFTMRRHGVNAEGLELNLQHLKHSYLDQEASVATA